MPARPPDSLGTWELHHRAFWHLYKLTAEDNLSAITPLNQAAQRDYDFAAPHAALALATYFQGWLYRPEERAQFLLIALQHGRRAVALDAQDAMEQAYDEDDAGWIG